MTEPMPVFAFDPDDREGAPVETVPFPDWGPVVAVLVSDFAERHGSAWGEFAHWPSRFA